MLAKAGLVAQREILENVRTKTFWIGILIFPVILVVAVVIPALLEGSKSDRLYAVVDHSGWLLDAVDQRSIRPDLERVLHHAVLAYRNQDAAFDTLPPEMQRLTMDLDANLRQVTSNSSDAGGDAAQPADGTSLSSTEAMLLRHMARQLAGLDEMQEQLSQQIDADLFGEVQGLQQAIDTWWRALPEDEAASFGTTRHPRFHRVEVSGSGEALLDELNRRVADGELFAYFVIAEDPVEGEGGHRYVSSNLTDDGLRSWFSSLASAAVREKRLAAEQIDPDVVRWVQQSLKFEVKKVGAGGEEEDVDTKDLVREWAPVAFVYLLWISIFTISQMLLTNTIEEKSNRIIEVLLSSLSPVQLMAGKILGIAATGLIMIGSWIGFFFFAVKAIPWALGLDLGFDLGVIATDPIYLVSFVVYFVLGYLLFATLFTGIGSLCNSLKEAQNLQMPVTLVLMVPLFTMIPVAQDPNGTLAKVLSYIPPFTPFVMMNRAAGPPTALEYVVTTALLLLSIAVALWGTAKVFRVGILMTGKPPRLLEILKWLRAPVGVIPNQRDGSFPADN